MKTRLDWERIWLHRDGLLRLRTVQILISFFDVEVRQHWARELMERIGLIVWNVWLLLLWRWIILKGGGVELLTAGLGRWRGAVKRPEGRRLSDPRSSN